MNAALLVGLLSGCWTPKETSPTGMVGRVLDHDGNPVVGVTVESLEARMVTDAEGRFAVSYKSPTQYVFFPRDGVQFERHYRDADHHQEVELRLPTLASRNFVCELDAECEARLIWETAPGTRAVVRGTCNPEVNGARFTAPAEGLPLEAWCRSAPDQPERRLAIRDSGTFVRLTEEPVPLTIGLQTSTLPMPTECAVRVDGIPATNTGAGAWTSTTWGRTEIHATCDGIPATPKMLIVRQPARVDLAWEPTTPVVHLAAWAPGALQLRIAQVAGKNNGWSMVLDLGADRGFVLPRLGPGTYVFGVDTTLEQLRALKPASDNEPGTLHITDVPGSDGHFTTFGVLELTEPLLSGELPVIHYREDAVAIPEAAPATNKAPE